MLAKVFLGRSVDLGREKIAKGLEETVNDFLGYLHASGVSDHCIDVVGTGGMIVVCVRYAPGEGLKGQHKFERVWEGWDDRTA